MAATFAPEYADKAVTAGSTHTYGLAALDYDGNSATVTSFSVTAPASGAVPPQETGVRASGSYWGGMGEQIDMRSGNLNYAYPLVTIMSRGSSLPLGLAYNSQNWRLDPNGSVWNLGADVGYGFGWRLQFGSVTPYSSSAWNIAYYSFRDASGAVYRLDQRNGFLWTSKDSTYVTYDAEKAVLHFSDGSSWLMDDIASGLEADAGTLYPSEMEDSNGNMTWIDYQGGNSASDPSNSSNRIADIFDSRSGNAVLQGPPIQGPPSLYYGISGTPTYSFGYDSNGYLSSVTNNVGSGESFTFSYSAPVTLTAPFSSSQFGTVKTLTSITNTTTQLATNFSYDAANAGELMQVTFPYGGHMRWQYGNLAYSQATLRAVNGRYLYWDSYLGERPYSLSFALSGNSSVTASSTVVDQHANAGKRWNFDTAQEASQGLATSYQQYRTTDGTVLRQLNYSWTQDAVGRNYINRTQDVADPGQSYAATKQTDQTMDRYGNVTQTKVYAFGNLTTPARTYTSTYLTGANYANLYIFNRLLSSSVTDSNNQTLTLVVAA